MIEEFSALRGPITVVFIRQFQKLSVLNHRSWRQIVLIWVISTIIPLSAQVSPDSIECANRQTRTLRTWIFLERTLSSPLIKDDSLEISTRAITRRKVRGIEPRSNRSLIDQPISPDFIRRIEKTGVKIKQVSRWINAVSVRATSEQLLRIEALPFVAGIQRVKQYRRISNGTTDEGLVKSLFRSEKDGKYGPSENQLAMLNVPALHELGYTGKDVTILMLDTGFMTNHTALGQNRIKAQYDFVNNDNQTQNENTSENEQNQHEHGTMTASVAGGAAPGSLIGPAYECDFILAKTELVAEEIILEEDNFVAALEWGERMGADIASSSIGYNEWYEYDQMDGRTAITTRAVHQAVRLGMVVIVSAGNERGSGGKPDWGGYIVAPADADSIITVGAVYSNGQVTSFSGIGPTADGRIKPEVVALGSGVSVASTLGPAKFTTRNGTSFAAPLIAGSVALLLQAHPNWGPMDIRSALLNTATQSAKPDNYVGYGLPDILSALYFNPDDSSSTGGILPRDGSSPVIVAYPNPLYLDRSKSTLINWTLVARTPVRIDVYNLLGEHIINLYHHYLQEPEPGSVSWDGVDSNGRKVASGGLFGTPPDRQDYKYRPGDRPAMKK